MTNHNNSELEFGGPWGALATTLCLPIVTIWLAHCASIGSIYAIPSFTILDQTVISENDDIIMNIQPMMTKYAIGFCISWFVFLVVLERILPCELISGVELPGTGKQTVQRPRLQYRINGHLSLWVILAVIGLGRPFTLYKNGVTVFAFEAYEIGSLCDYFLELAVALVVLSTLLSIWLYIKSFAKDAQLALGGNTGIAVYDFFIGRELNPRSLSNSFDWKEFCELRPGLILWMLLDLAMAVKQYQLLGYVTGSMILINAFQGFYVWDALYNERAILTTMDITTDGFGFMLCFGDLAWVPITYSLQARYLVEHDPHLSLSQLIGIVACNCFGYFVFRSANSQKDAFRTDPNDASLSHLTYLQTKRGTKLLTSGWWGRARKINYTGDWIMGLSWCLLCGLESIVPYFYAIYFCILLIHRAARDDHMCSEKYGEDWNKYKQVVPYQFIPGVI